MGEEVECQIGEGGDEVDVEGYAGECHGGWRCCGEDVGSGWDTSRLYGKGIMKCETRCHGLGETAEAPPGTLFQNPVGLQD